MKEVYDLSQHTRCVAFSLGNSQIKMFSYTTSRRCVWDYNKLSRITHTKDTCISYNEQRNILNWGDDSFNRGNINDIRINKFKETLYHLFKKGKDNWDQDNLFFLEAVATFMRLLIGQLTKELQEKKKDKSALHYVFITPSEWEDEIREVLIRPIFVQASLISKCDHKDRLLFRSDLNGFCAIFTIEQGKYTTICRISQFDEDQVLLKLDLVSTIDRLSNLSVSLTSIKVVQSNAFCLTVNHVKTGIKEFIRTGVLLDVSEETLKMITEDFYRIHLRDTDINRKEKETKFDANLHLMEPVNIDTSKWILNRRQQLFIQSIRPFDICSQICNTMLNNFKDLLPNNLVRKHYIFTFLDETVSEFLLDINLAKWVIFMVEYSRIYFDRKNIVHKYIWPETIDHRNVIEETYQFTSLFLWNSDVGCKPRILLTQDLDSSSSIFLKSKPNTIINIDITLESTLLSFSILDDTGLVKKIWNHGDFVTTAGLRSLGSFFTFSEVIKLNVKYSFIAFVEKCLIGNANFFSCERDTTTNEDVIADIEAILCEGSDTKDIIVSIQQQKYINAFIYIYMIYLNKVVSSKLSNITEYNPDIKVGYAITTEKMLLERIFGTEEDLREITYASGLLQKNDDSKKLRAILQGETILPAIQPFLEEQPTIKSFFVQAQSYENYVYLTLNQVVTEPILNGNEAPESIVIGEQIIPIRNIYDSFCLNMCDSLVENLSLIKLCNKHKKKDNVELLEIFSLENQRKFKANLKQYIFNNILNKNSFNQNTDGVTIDISPSCSCKVSLTLNDIIEISFLPVLQDIISLVCTSLFKPILVKLLKDETDQFMYEQRIDVPHYVTAELQSHLFRPVLYHQPFSYKGFQVGVLRQVYSQSYGFAFHNKNENACFFYKNKLSDTEKIPFDKDTVFPFIKMGDRMKRGGEKRVFYMESQQKLNTEHDLGIRYFKLKNMDNLRFDKTVRIEDTLEAFAGRDISSCDFLEGQYISFVIHSSFAGFSSSLCLGTDFAGKNARRFSSIANGEQMTLARF